MPILEDLYNILRNQKEPEAQRIATALEIYVHGSLNVFNHRTNVDVNNRFVCYDIRELGKQLKKLGTKSGLSPTMNARSMASRRCLASTRTLISSTTLPL